MQNLVVAYLTVCEHPKNWGMLGPAPGDSGVTPPKHAPAPPQRVNIPNFVALGQTVCA